MEEMDIERFLKMTYTDDVFLVRGSILCQDGFMMSIQASHVHYCEPRENLKSGCYAKVEIGYPSEIEDLLIPYAENEHNYLDSVYPYVPIAVVEAVIQKHGGMAVLY